MPAPFFRLLPKTHTVPAYSIAQPTTLEAKELKTLLWAGMNDEYQRKLEEYKERGKQFVVRENGVEEILPGDRTIDVKIAVQVKRYTITWYFWTKTEDQDLYSQQWRDLLYDAAAECHSHVERGCGLYYRGSDAFHLKTMHNAESEAERNHNHYRMQENQEVRPEDFRQHMEAFKSAKHKDVSALFLSQEYELVMMSNLPKNKVEFAEAGKIYIAEDGTYLVRDHRATRASMPEFVHRGRLSNEFDLSNLASKLSDPEFKSKVLEVTSKAGHTLTEEESRMDIIGNLCQEFDKFYLDWKTPEADGTSKADKYNTAPDQQLNEADLLEFRLFGAQQEPCRLSVDELTVDYERARKAIETQINEAKTATLQSNSALNQEKMITELQNEVDKVIREYNALLAFREKGGSRGLGSNRAYTRQLPGSHRPTYPMSGSLGFDAPPVPAWATTLKERVDEAIVKFAHAPALSLDRLDSEQREKIGVSQPKTKPVAEAAVDERAKEKHSSTENNVSAALSRHGMFGASSESQEKNLDPQNIPPVSSKKQ